MSDEITPAQPAGGKHVVTSTSEPIADPGLPAHEPRPTDVDPAAERRAERQVATLFGLSMVFTVLFVVAYFVFEIKENADTILGLGASNVTLGLTLGLALLMIGIGAIQWARKLMSDVEITEERHSAASPPEDREATLEALRQGTEDSGIARRPLVRNTLLGAVAMLGLPAVVSLRDLAPELDPSVYEHTIWGEPEAGTLAGGGRDKSVRMRVVQDVDGAPIRPRDMEIGQLVNAEPIDFFLNTDGDYVSEEGGEPLYEGGKYQNAKVKAAVIVVRMHPDDITPLPGRENWGIDGILCYSKICTHVGCPISLWEQQTHHLLCPCHQSTFDLADNGRVVFGPAARALPQLPLELDDEGYLVAGRDEKATDFLEPVGPSYWERG